MHVIHEGAPVTCEWESLQMHRDGSLSGGRMVLVVGLVPMAVTYETAARIASALLKEMPSELCMQLEASIRQNAERHPRPRLERVK